MRFGAISMRFDIVFVYVFGNIGNQFFAYLKAILVKYHNIYKHIVTEQKLADFIYRYL